MQQIDRDENIEASKRRRGAIKQRQFSTFLFFSRHSVLISKSGHAKHPTMNSNQLDPRQHPLEAIGAAIGAEEQTELQTRSSNFQGADEGPASVIAKVSGAQSGGKREDGSSDLPNNKGTPRPNPYVFHRSG